MRVMALLVTALLMAACGPEQRTDASQAAPCAQPYGPEADPLPAKVEIHHAENLAVRYAEGYKVVEVRTRDLHSRPQPPDRLVLIPCGAPVPPLTGDLAGATVIEVPVRTVAATEDSDAKRVVALGLDGRLVGIGGSGVYDPEIRRRWKAKEIARIGLPLHGTPDFEKLLEIRPDLTIFFTADADRAKALERARALGLTAVPSYAWSERSFLGQAEWVKYTALFFNAEAEANRFFGTVEARYRALAARARAAQPKPTVFWGGPADGDRWWVERNGPESLLLEDAGAVNLLRDPQAGPFAGLDTGAVVERAAQADYWITGAVSDREWESRVPLDVFAAYRAGRVFHHHKRAIPAHNAFDWYETALVRPDLVLEDLVSIFHPDLTPGHEPLFFGPIERTQVREARR